MVGGPSLKKSRNSLTAKCSLIFPVPRVRRYLKNAKLASRIGVGSAIYLTAVLEYLTVEMMELAGDVADQLKRKSITSRHLLLAIRQDEELQKLLKNTILPSGGVVPRINPYLVEDVGKNSLPSKTVLKKVKTKVVSAAKVPKSKPPTTTTKYSTGYSNNTNAQTKIKGFLDNCQVLHSETLHLGQKLHVVQGDISEQSADIVVSPTDSRGSFNGMVGVILALKGGSALVDDVNSRSLNLKPGTCCVTPGYDLSFKNVLHLNSPVYGRSADPKEDLHRAIMNVLAAADAADAKTLALPAVGSGHNGYPADLAAYTIIDAIDTYFNASMASSIKEIKFVLYDSATVDVYMQQFKMRSAGKP